MNIMKTEASLVAVGDNVVDNYMDRGEFYPGGNAVNVAVLTKRYGLSNTAYIGIFGNDREGDHVKYCLKEEGVNIDLVRTAVGENGKAYVTLNNMGDRIFGESNKGGVQSRLKLNFHPSDLEFISNFSLLHTSIYSNINDDLSLLSNYTNLSYDFSVDKQDNTLKSVCPYTQFAFFSCSEMSHKQTVSFGEYVRSLGPEHVLMTRGEEGAVYIGKSGIHSQEISPVKAVDTLGAGDSYISAFLVAMLQGLPASEGMKKGAAAASQTCLQYGAFGYPHKFFSPQAEGMR